MINSKKLAREVRDKRGSVARTDIAEECGVPYSCLTRIENGYGQPSLDNYAKICDWLGRSMDYYRTGQKATA